MTMDDALYALFAPLAQGAPGDDATTLRALDAVPGRTGVRQVLDLGAGQGRAALALARALPRARIAAVEIHPPFVERIAARARAAGLAGRVHAVCADMAKIAVAAGSIDLIWAEGSIYLPGRERALAQWRPWLRPGGCAAFSDLAWWTGDPAADARAFWTGEYPDMASEAAIRSAAEAAGYLTVASFRVSKAAHDAYYLPLAARAAELAGRADAGMRQVLAGLRREIEVGAALPGSGGLHVLRRPARRRRRHGIG